MSVLEDKLRQKNLKITPQRLEILRALRRVPAHPTAECLYQAVKRRYPAVSLATVYKTLETLVEIGEIRVAMVSKGRTHYDTRLDDHHHFLCQECDFIEDVDVGLNCLQNCRSEELKNKHRVLRSEVVFHGVCHRCSQSMQTKDMQVPVV